MNPPHTCPGSHLSLLGSSRRVGGHRQRGGRAARGAERSERRGPRPPEGRSAPPSGRRPGRRRVEMGGAGGEALPRAAARPFQGEVLLWGAQTLSPPRPTGAPRAQGAQLLPGPHSVPGPSPSSPPPPCSSSPRAPGPLTGPFPVPTAQGSRDRPGPPAVSGVQAPPTSGSRGGGGRRNLPPSPGPAPGQRLPALRRPGKRRG
nr:proline-rich protein HaeIII subfamily 1-like [Cavia porcellus]